MIALIVARATNNVIGNTGVIPWHLSSDLEHFKAVTKGSIVVMGRKTYESIGRPLPNRTNIIITSNRDYPAQKLKSCIVLDCISDALVLAKASNKDLFFIGGQRIYEEGLQYCDRLFITEVDCVVEGDTFFDCDLSEFTKLHMDGYIKSDKNDYNFQIHEYVRNGS